VKEILDMSATYSREVQRDVGGGKNKGLRLPFELFLQLCIPYSKEPDKILVRTMNAMFLIYKIFEGAQKIDETLLIPPR